MEFAAVKLRMLPDLKNPTVIIVDDRFDKNTFATLGATEDRIGYMSKYSFSDSIRNHATLPLNFEPVPVDLRVDRDTMDREFDILTRDLPDSDKAELSKRVNMQTIMYNEKRIHKVCAHIAKHFTEKICSNGYKA